MHSRPSPCYYPSITPQLSPELRQALAAIPEHPVRIEDEHTHRVYFVVSQEQVRSLLEAELLGELEIAYDDIARGDVMPFDPEDFKRRGLERMQISDKQPNPHPVRSMTIEGKNGQEWKKGQVNLAERP